MNELNERDIYSIIGMLYDLDVLYEDKPSDLKDEIENSLDKKKAYFIEKNETLVVFFRERFYEDVKNVIYEKCWC